MVVYVLERSPLYGARLWVEKPGEIPRLVKPPPLFRRRFGGELAWGEDSRGARLTAATLMFLCGFTARASVMLADTLATRMVSQFKWDRVPIERPVLDLAVRALLDEFCGYIYERLSRRRQEGRND